MNGREAKAAPSADLLVCFPSRAHLTLMPKPLCSPARPSETNKRHPNYHKHHRHFKRSNTRGGVQDSPLLWAKTKPMGSEMISEPTSPKVTCAGQIKVRSKTSSCSGWQSVMEEVERIHINGKRKKRPSWVEALGLKKDIVQFLTCLRSLRFDCRCFGSFRKSDITTEDEDGEEDHGEYRENHVGFEGSDGNETSRTAFSKWFVVLPENQSNMLCKQDEKEIDQRSSDDECIAAPPPNALLLMRCRSAPSKGWLEEKEEDRQVEDHEDHKDEKGKENGERKAKSLNLKCLMEGAEMRTKKEKMVVMKYDTDFYTISSDVAKETWIAGGMRGRPFSRSRSWKR